MILLAAALVLTQPLLIRRAQVDISPPELLPLGGYTERHDKLMEPGGDPLYARCIELQQGETKIAIVSVEMLTIPESLHREVSARIPKDVHLFMQATHTHSAPDSQMLNDRMTFKIPGISTFKRRWLAWYADKIASAVTAAESSKPLTCRSLMEFMATCDANRSRRAGGKPDKRFILVTTDQKSSSPFALEPTDNLFTYYTAHPTIYGEDRLQTSGDWVAGLAKIDDDVVLNGALGDISPSADGPDYHAKFESFFNHIDAGLGAKRAMATVIWRPSNPVGFASASISLGPKVPHPTFAKANGIPSSLAQSLVDQFAPSSDDIAVVRVGALAIVGVPGEPTSIVGNQIREAGEKLGFKTVLVCSHVNGWMGYILDPEDYDRGGYEASLSFYGREQGNKVVDAAVAALRKF
ncbi:MAG: neutral/alkaline non-lysosomal ceramidase N-terminal domain-containing protein [Fimbriimonadales bacterium]